MSNRITQEQQSLLVSALTTKQDLMRLRIKMENTPVAYSALRRALRHFSGDDIAREVGVSRATVAHYSNVVRLGEPVPAPEQDIDWAAIDAEILHQLDLVRRMEACGPGRITSQHRISKPTYFNAARGPVAEARDEYMGLRSQWLNHTNANIARRHGVSESTVSRRSRQIRQGCELRGADFRRAG